MAPVPETGLAVNFSPMPRMAPPPLGRLTVGARTSKLEGVAEFSPAGESSASDCLIELLPSGSEDRWTDGRNTGKAYINLFAQPSAEDRFFFGPVSSAIPVSSWQFVAREQDNIFDLVRRL